MLLTDDEVISAAVQSGLAWPYPLPTVELDRDSMLDAGARGARSLLVRGLATADSSSLTIDESVSLTVAGVASSPQHVVAYVADRSTPAVLTGSSTYLYFSSTDRPDILDLVSASGVHDLREANRDDGVELFLAVIENAFRLGIRTSSVDAEPVLFSFSNLGPQAIAVAKGRLELGERGLEGGTFEQSESFTNWDATLLREALGLTSTVTPSHSTNGESRN